MAIKIRIGAEPCVPPPPAAARVPVGGVTWALRDNNCFATAVTEVFGARLHLEAFKLSAGLPDRRMNPANYHSYAGKDEDVVDLLLRHATELELREGRYAGSQVEGLPHGAWLLFAEPAS